MVQSRSSPIGLIIALYDIISSRAWWSSTCLEVLAALSAHSERFGLPFKPFHRHGALFKVALGFRMNIRMILIQPMLLLPRQQTLVDQLPAVRNHCDVLEAKIGFFPKGVFRLGLFYHDDILNSDTEGPILVITRLVRDNITYG